MKVKLGVLTAGGDCPGINSAIHWLVNSGLDKDLVPSRGMMFDILGIKDGWRGLMEVNPDKRASMNQWTVRLDNDVVRTWDRYGGTRLGTSRFNPLDPTDDKIEQILKNYEKLGLDALVVLGGFENLGVAYRLYREGLKIVGIPKTIDRDLEGTDYTLGFDSALNIITEDIDRLRVTAGSHSRIFVVECMGRKAGWLALEGGRPRVPPSF
ncbi:MAG: 6-phosphofructokinase [Deltaproteobacteria bacterium]|nr:6-phosphofructokinase [Deltaproteobacteria bacterium]